MSSEATESFEGIRPAGVSRQEIVVEIDAARERVWRALTEEVAAWWLPDFHMAHPESRVTAEMTPGGRLFEEGPDGSSLLWFQVVAVRPGESVHWAGWVMPPWGGPAMIQDWLRLEAAGPKKTILRLTDCAIGQVDEAMVRSMREGWTALFGEGLRRFAEKQG